MIPNIWLVVKHKSTWCFSEVLFRSTSGWKLPWMQNNHNVFILCKIINKCTVSLMTKKYIADISDPVFSYFYSNKGLCVSTWVHFSLISLYFFLMHNKVNTFDTSGEQRYHLTSLSDLFFLANTDTNLSASELTSFPQPSIPPVRHSRKQLLATERGGGDRERK